MLFAPGCGDSEDSTAASLTKAEFLKQGNAICEKGELARAKAMEKASKDFKPGRTVAEQEENRTHLIEAAIPPFEAMTEELSELPPPAGEEEKVEEIIAAMEESADKASAEPAFAGVKNRFFERSQDLLREYGLICLG